MAEVEDIGWGRYKSYEGPFYKGRCAYVLSGSPSEAEKIVAVITATEGGRYDAINMYDRCILSSGLIQWCEAGQYSVSDMIGKLSGITQPRGTGHPIDVMYERAPINFSFNKNAKGRWRFFMNGNEVDTIDEQRRLFLSCSGELGGWDEASKHHAKRWAAAVASVWENGLAQEAQRNYTVVRLNGFALPYALELLNNTPATDVGRAFRAAYMSFAANNPTWANRHLQIAVDSWTGAAWTLDWLVHVLKELTFGPKVVIYPHRYNAIRPVLEKLYGLNLPDFSKELEVWKAGQSHSFFFDTVEIQRALITLGFDLGPAGADGRYGGKTKDAVLSFEQLDYGEDNKVPVEHQDGMVDEWTARKLEEVLEKRGIEILQGGA